MHKIIPALLGPELYWLCIYSLLIVIIKVTHAPAKALDDGWVNLAYLVPLVLIPLSFGCYWLVPGNKKLLLLRLAISGLVGSHVVLETGLSVHSEQGPGVGTAYLMGLLFGIVVLALLSIGLLLKELVFPG